MLIKFHPSAEDEFLHAVDYYEDIQSHLGLEFASEDYEDIERIESFPQAWQKMTSKTRRCLINRFPFGVIYHIKDDTLIIVAVMHLSKQPNYWKERIEL
jgi:hypothetical protein